MVLYVKEQGYRPYLLSRGKLAFFQFLEKQQFPRIKYGGYCDLITVSKNVKQITIFHHKHYRYAKAMNGFDRNLGVLFVLLHAKGGFNIMFLTNL